MDLMDLHFMDHLMNLDSPRLVFYGVAMRTNNDVEGWHTRLNHRARKGRYLPDFPHFVI